MAINGVITWPVTSSSVTYQARSSFSHTWTIANFVEIPRDVVCLYSDIFKSPEWADYWCLRITPFVRERQEWWVGLELGLHQSSKPYIRAQFRLSVVNQNNQECLTSQCASAGGSVFYPHVLISPYANLKPADTSVSCYRGLRRFVPRDFIFYPNFRLLRTDGSLQVRVTVTQYGDFENRPVAPPAQMHITALKRLKVASSFEIEMAGLLLSDTGDVEIFCEDKVTLRAHSFILKTRCPVFYTVFMQNFTTNEPVTRIIEKDNDSVTIRQVLYYLYTDVVKQPIRRPYMLLYAADMYNIDKIKFACEQHIAKEMNEQNVADALIVAYHCNLHHLSRIAKLLVIEKKLYLRDSFMEDIKPWGKVYDEVVREALTNLK